MKHRYHLIINHGYASKKPYIYVYRNTKDIQLHMHSGSAMISFQQGAAHSGETVRTYSDYLCSDAIKKAMLIHLILYAKALPIHSLQLSVDGQVSDVPIDKGDPVVYSMINHPLDTPLPPVFKTEAVISSLLNTSRSSYDGRNNALIALLLAKACSYRSEKSMFLWMTMNGLYGFLSGKANRYAPNSKARIDSEWQEHNLMCTLHGWGLASMNNISKEEKTKIMQEAMSLLRRSGIPPQTAYSCLRERRTNQLSEDLEALLGKRNKVMDPYPFFCVWLPYQIRCYYFHSNSAIPLFSYPDEPIIAALQYTNCFVEAFLEEYLPQWLNTTELTEEQDKRIEEAYRKTKGLP